VLRIFIYVYLYSLEVRIFLPDKKRNNALQAAEHYFFQMMVFLI